jgi:hypothetical protein
VKVPFSKLKKRCREKFRRAKWLYESGEIEKYDCAFYRKAKERRIPPTKLGKAKPTGFDTKWAVEKIALLQRH